MTGDSDEGITPAARALAEAIREVMHPDYVPSPSDLMTYTLPGGQEVRMVVVDTLSKHFVDDVVGQEPSFVIIDDVHTEPPPFAYNAFVDRIRAAGPGKTLRVEETEPTLRPGNLWGEVLRRARYSRPDNLHSSGPADPVKRTQRKAQRRARAITRKHRKS